MYLQLVIIGHVAVLLLPTEAAPRAPRRDSDSNLKASEASRPEGQATVNPSSPGRASSRARAVGRDGQPSAVPNLNRRSNSRARANRTSSGSATVPSPTGHQTVDVPSSPRAGSRAEASRVSPGRSHSRASPDVRPAPVTADVRQAPATVSAQPPSPNRRANDPVSVRFEYDNLIWNTVIAPSAVRYRPLTAFRHAIEGFDDWLVSPKHWKYVRLESASAGRLVETDVPLTDDMTWVSDSRLLFRFQSKPRTRNPALVDLTVLLHYSDVDVEVIVTGLQPYSAYDICAAAVAKANFLTSGSRPPVDLSAWRQVIMERGQQITRELNAEHMLLSGADQMEFRVVV